jgi:hypothetical protein
MAIFCGIIVLFLERSIGQKVDNDRVEYYLPPCVGCAFANYFGNAGQHFVAIVIILLSIAYIFKVLKPFSGFK